LVFANATGLTRVDMASGRSDLIYQRAQGDPPVEYPQMLPGGRAVVYVEIPTAGTATIVVRDALQRVDARGWRAGSHRGANRGGSRQRVSLKARFRARSVLMEAS
jgi:hypothetical protein